MRKPLSRILTVLIIMGLSLLCAFASYAGNDTGAPGASPYAEIKVYSKDSSQGKVINGGTMVVDADASVVALGNKIDISGVKNTIYAEPGEGYIFDGWENVPESKRVKDGTMILAKFSPIGLETASYVTASVSKESKDMGSISPKSKIKVLTNSEVQVKGSTVLIARESFSAIPKKGKTFSHWEGIPEDGTIHGDTAITAVFTTPEEPVTVTFVVPNSGGDFISTTGSNEITMPSGAEIIVNDSQIMIGGTEYVKAIPHTDYGFYGWVGIPSDGHITEDTSISATFTPVITTEKAGTYDYSKTKGEDLKSDQKYGTMDEPVTDGIWVRDNDSSWTYNWHVPMANSWGCLDNPYAHDNQPGHGWFFFDRTGQMLTGWHVIDNKWYYFEPISNGCKGQLYSNTTTPDGYQVDETGARIEKTE